MTKVKRYFKDNLGIIAALAVMILFLYVFPRTHTTFLTKTNIFNVLRQSSTNLMLACGMTMVIILGGIDLSVGSIIAMSGVLGAAAMVWNGIPVIVGVLIAIRSGAIFRLRDGQVEFATDLNPSTAGERLLLQPGQYELVLHPQNATKYDKVQTKRFVIESSQTTKLTF